MTIKMCKLFRFGPHSCYQLAATNSIDAIILLSSIVYSSLTLKHQGMRGPVFQ